MKMNLSRNAKKFRAMMPQEAADAKKNTKKKEKKGRGKNATPAPVETSPPTPVVEQKPAAPAAPVVEVVAPPPTPPTPKREWVKTKHTRFVREKTEKRQRVTLPPLATGSTAAAKLLSQKVVPLPKEEVKLR